MKPDNLDEAVHYSQFLTFYISGEEYGVNITRVKEIIEYAVMTKVPSAPRWIRGVINLRGQVVPVTDLTEKFNLSKSPVTRRTSIVIIEVEKKEEKWLAGIVVDSVDQVIDLSPEEIQPSPSFGTPLQVDLLEGLGKKKEKFVLILDADKIFPEKELP